MAGEIADRVLGRLEEKICGLSSTSFECSIFIVPDQLRRINEKAYEPEILAIGPYHHGKDRLEAMEMHKLRYLQKLLQRTGETELSRYVEAMSALEERAHKCYKASIGLNRDEFVEMLLLDSCFIVELIRKNKLRSLRDDNDPIFKLDWMLPFIARDMFLLENQLPFFVVWEAFNMTAETPDRTNNSLNMILYFFNGILPKAIHSGINAYSIEQINHLVGLVHDNWLPSTAKMKAPPRISGNTKHWKFICCATEIQEAGIKFQKVDGGSLFDIKFERGVMKIPTLLIGDATESVFRNLIAYEQFSQDRNSKHIIDYIKFMDCLINSPEDAELLRRYGIIDNWLGNDEVIAKLINSLGDGVVLGENFYYSDVFKKVNSHCSRRLNQWKAKLRHDYFNTPWAIISFLAALVLLVLTFQQTLFSVLSYIKQ